MDYLVKQFDNLNVSNNIKLDNNKIIATYFIKKGTIISNIYGGKIKYFWEIYPDVSKTITINNDIVLDITDNYTILKHISESIYNGNCKLDYDIDEQTGNIYNFRIVSIKDIYIEDELILQYNYLL